MKNNITKKFLAALLMLPLVALAFPVGAFVPPPNWNVTGSYVVAIEYQSIIYPHDMNLTQDGFGSLTGNGGSPAGANTYLWTITSGIVSGDTIDFLADYTATPDAVTPQTTMHVVGTIAQNGSMSGTWSDNYAGQNRSGTWSTTSGAAVAIPPIQVNVVTNSATGITSTDATLNGTNGNSAASGHSFWVSLSSFATTSSTIPAGVYSTPDFGAIGANATFSASLSSVTTTGVPSNLPAITPNTTYYFAAWSNVEGTWYPGEVLSFTTSNSEGSEGSNNDGQIGGEVTQSNGVLNVDSITTDKATSTADGTFAGGWKYTFHITLPTNEPNLAMKFTDWTGVPSGTIPTANNVRISSLQASNSATVLLTAANVYSTPKINMVTDLNLLVAGIQADVVVEVAVPIGTPAASYTSTYGINTTP